MDAVFSHLVFWHWFALAVILGILDVVCGANFFFVWCGIAAAIVGFLELIFPSIIWEIQLLIFGVGIIGSVFIWRQYLNTHPRLSDKPGLNRRAAQNIGRTFTLEEAIVNGHGKVRVGDSLWIVSGEDMPVGTHVKVIAVDGTILKVEKI